MHDSIFPGHYWQMSTIGLRYTNKTMTCLLYFIQSLSIVTWTMLTLSNNIKLKHKHCKTITSLYRQLLMTGLSHTNRTVTPPSLILFNSSSTVLVVKDASHPLCIRPWSMQRSLGKWQKSLMKWVKQYQGLWCFICLKTIETWIYISGVCELCNCKVECCL